MQVVYERCAGLDIHKRTVVACATTPSVGGQAHKERRTFSTMTKEVSQMRDWLGSLGVTHVSIATQMWLMRLVGEPSKEACEMEQFLAKQGETGSAIQEPLVRFNFVHGPFDWPLTPRKGQSRSYGIIIPFNANHKTVEFFDTTLTRLLHPAIESFWLSLA